MNQSDLSPRAAAKASPVSETSWSEPTSVMRRDPPSPVAVAVPGGDVDRHQGAQAGPRGLDGRHRYRRRPGVIGIAGTRDTDAVTCVRNRGEGARSGVPPRRGRVLGGGHGPVRELHDLAGRVGHGQIGEGALVAGSAVGLAVEITGVGVPPVGPEAGHHVRAGRHGLGLEFLEPPRPALRTRLAERSPSGRRLVGNDPRDVLLEGNDVDGPGGAGRVEDGLDRSPHGQVAPSLAQLERPRRRGRVAEAGVGSRVGGGIGHVGPRRGGRPRTAAARSPPRRSSDRRRPGSSAPPRRLRHPTRRR